MMVLWRLGVRKMSVTPTIWRASCGLALLLPFCELRFVKELSTSHSSSSSPLANRLKTFRTLQGLEKSPFLFPHFSLKLPSQAKPESTGRKPQLATSKARLARVALHLQRFLRAARRRPHPLLGRPRSRGRRRGVLRWSEGGGGGGHLGSLRGLEVGWKGGHDSTGF